MSAKRKSGHSPIVHQPAAQLYDHFVEGIRERIRTAQIKAALAANAELILHYWEIGRDILASQKQEGWGTKVIDRLAADLQREFPQLSGYSARNLKYMRAFAAAWPDRAIVHQLGAQIPWKHTGVTVRTGPSVIPPRRWIIRNPRERASLRTRWNVIEKML